jgi:hypothetical protein
MAVSKEMNVTHCFLLGSIFGTVTSMILFLKTQTNEPYIWQLSLIDRHGTSMDLNNPQESGSCESMGG